MYGYAGKILRVDLTHEKISTTKTMQYAGRFLGGRGINQWILFNESEPNIAPLDPESLLIFGTGPLNGTLAPASGRIMITFKNAYSGGVGWANAGGDFAPELKYAGYDHLIVQGKAEKPVYLWINNDTVEIRDASAIKGKDTNETVDILRRELRDNRVSIVCIGPAGENRVLGSSIMVSKTRAAAGCGGGAVMGSKNLKAVAVRGTKPIEVVNPDEFMEVVNESINKIEDFYIRGANKYRSLGTYQDCVFLNEHSSMPVRNHQDGTWSPSNKKILDPTIPKEEYEERMLSGFACPIGCDHYYRITKGPYAGTECAGFQQQSHWGFGSNWDIDDDIASIIKINDIVNRMGLDIDAVSTVLAWALECYDRGILTKQDLDGYALKWGDHETLLEFVRKIAYRDGVGDLFAEGIEATAKKIGKGSEYYAMYTKKQPMLDPIRAAKGWALGIITSTRGNRHLSGAPLAEFAEINSKLGEELYGVPTAGNPTTYEGKGKLVTWYEQFKAMIDCMGLCYFVTWWISPGGELLGPYDYAKLYSTATGMNKSAEQLMRMGEQITNLEKAFNMLHSSYTKEDDKPPKRLMEEPIKSGTFREQKLEEDKWQEMLTEYYKSHGWNPETGMPAEDSFEKLDLPEVVNKLKMYHKL